MLFNKDSAIQKCFQKILHSLQVRKFGSLPAVRTMCHTVRTPICPKHHPSGRREISFRTFLCVEKIRTAPACIRTDISAHVRTTLSVWQASGFLSKTQLWEDCCNHPDDVDSHPDALIHKASMAFKIQTFERQSAWSGCACIRYGNCMHQINRPDDHPPGLDTRSLYMEITCSGSVTVRTTGHHRPDAAQNRKEFQRNFWKADRTVVRPDALWPPSGRRLGFIKLDAHLNPQPINRSP
jgi:hypothetical protein